MGGGDSFFEMFQRDQQGWCTERDRAGQRYYKESTQRSFFFSQVGREETDEGKKEGIILP